MKTMQQQINQVKLEEYAMKTQSGLQLFINVRSKLLQNAKRHVEIISKHVQQTVYVCMCIFVLTTLT